MLEVLYQGQNAFFTFCLAVFILLTVLEIVLFFIGFGLSSLCDGLFPDFDLPGLDGTNVGFMQRVFGWLMFGHIPPYFFFLIFMATFGTVGTLFQYFSLSIINNLTPFYIAIPLAFIGSIPFVRLGVSFFKKILPKEDTSVVTEDHFIGKVVTITVGMAEYDKPAQAKFVDIHQQSHYLMVAPTDKTECFSSDDFLVVVAKENHIYRARRLNKL